jgi:hypothetical protein
MNGGAPRAGEAGLSAADVFDARHIAAFELLPWLVNGTLAAGERTEVLAHLDACLVCRRERERLRVLAALVRAPSAAQRCEEALHRMHARMQRQPRSPARAPWAAAATLVLVTGLVALLADSTESSVAWLRNTGLSMMSQSHVTDSAAPALRAHLVFYDNITERQLRALLLSVGADLIEGPTAGGVYTISFPRAAGAQEAAGALTALRHSRRVVYAEPLLANSVADW